MAEEITPDDRVAELIATYASPDACAAWLLCDRRASSTTAYRIVAADLSAQDLTYGELRSESEHLAAGFRSLGLGPGDRIATLMGKSRDYLVTLLAIWRLGGVHVPLFTAFAPAAIAFRLGGSGAKAVVADEAQLFKLAPGDDMPAAPTWQVIVAGSAGNGFPSIQALMAEALPFGEAAIMGGDAPLIHIYTSGTTGTPKGVVVAQRALAAFQAYAEFGQGIEDSDTFWCAADPGWAYGLYFGVLSTLTTGVRSILMTAPFTPESTMAVMEQEGVTNFAAAPTVYRSLRASGMAFPDQLALRRASSAGEPLTPDVNAWGRSVLKVEVRDHYGQTETGMTINNHHHALLAHPVRTGSMGQPMPGWRAAVLHGDRDEEIGQGEVGRLAFDLSRSPLAFFEGYNGDPANTAGKVTGGGRWYLTGDIASVSDDGYFTFSSRDDDVILMAGYRIGPFEVESAMVGHPAVSEAAVIAVPDDVRGEVMEAFVTLCAGHSASSDLALEIQQWVKTRYAAHAFPRLIHFVAELPKTPSGKVQRFVLKQRRLDEIRTAG